MCPFCGKSFKRLKTHLLHCKAAKSSKETLPQHEETKMSSSSSSLPPPGPDQSQHSDKTATSTQKMSLDTEEVNSKLTSDQVKMPSPERKKKNPTSRQNKMKNEIIEKIGADFEKLDLNQTAKQRAKPKTEKKNALKKELKNILTKKTSSNEAKVTVNDVKASPNDNVWSGEEDNKKPENNVWTPRQDAKITLHDVRASLGRPKLNVHQKTSSFVDRLPTDELKCEIVNQNEIPSQVMVLPPGKSQLVPLKSGNLMSELSKMERTDFNFTQRADILKDGLRMDRHTMGLAALSSPARTFFEAEVSTKVFGKDVALLLKPNEQQAKREMETRRDLGKQDGGRWTTREALSQQRLGQVRLRELPEWLVSRSPRRPRDALQMVQRGWQWYYRKYIDVKKGGIGGVAMLLVGYCVLSYVWAYPHLKRERWRKYH